MFFSVICSITFSLNWLKTQINPEKNVCKQESKITKSLSYKINKQRAAKGM